MYEMGIENSLFEYVLNGSKTIELRLRTPKFVTLRIGDRISFRKDTWNDDKLVSSLPDQAQAVVTGTTFFDTFVDAVHGIDFTAAAPNTQNPNDAIAEFAQHYTVQQQLEHGVVAITFKLLP